MKRKVAASMVAGFVLAFCSLFVMYGPLIFVREYRATVAFETAVLGCLIGAGIIGLWVK